jgi:hypothetical protein
VISSFSDYIQTCRGYRIKSRDTSIELTIVTTQRKYQLNGKNDPEIFTSQSN